MDKFICIIVLKRWTFYIVGFWFVITYWLNDWLEPFSKLIISLSKWETTLLVIFYFNTASVNSRYNVVWCTFFFDNTLFSDVPFLITIFLFISKALTLDTIFFPIFSWANIFIYAGPTVKKKLSLLFLLIYVYLKKMF